MKKTDIIIGLLTTILWGITFTIIGVGLKEFPPFFLSALRFTLVSLPFLYFVGKPCIPIKYIIIIGLVFGVLYFSFCFLGIYYGLATGLSAVVMQCQVIFTAIMGYIFFKEKLKVFHLIGIAISFVGLIAIGLSVKEESSFLGFIFIILASISVAAFNGLTKVSQPKNLLNFVVWISLIPPIPLFIISFILEGSDQITYSLINLTWNGIFALLFMVFISTLLCFAGWGYLLKKYSPNLISPFGFIIPVAGIISGKLILDETITPAQTTGIVFILSGLIVIVFHQKFIHLLSEKYKN